MLCTLGLLALYFLLPEPGPRIRPVPLSDDALRLAALSHKAPPPPPADGAEKELAALGRSLFNDRRLSANGNVACATCHDAQRHFTDGKPVSTGIAAMAKNTPTVINTYLNDWFFWDGRADSLASQALKPIEDPREHGISRLFVVNHLRKHYAAQYEAAFGPFPAALPADLPPQGMPAVKFPDMSIDASAYALATLGDFGLLSTILREAQKARLAPAVQLSRRAFSEHGDHPAPPTPAAWVEAYTSLPPAAQAAADHVFANFGKAIAAFERNIAAIDSPFDRFVAQLDRGAGLNDAMAASGFNETQLTGFRLFSGPGKCTLCHAGPNFTDQQFHNIGLPQHGDLVDVGRATGVIRALSDPFNCRSSYMASAAAAPAAGPPAPGGVGESCRELPYLDQNNLELVGAFKTPTLRNVALTAPYMHDGRFSTLNEVFAHYNRLEATPATGHREETLKPLDFTDEELGALAEFLTSLNSPFRNFAGEQQTAEGISSP